MRRLLDAVQVGAVTTDDALERLRRLPYADIGRTSRSPTTWPTGCRWLLVRVAETRW